MEDSYARVWLALGFCLVFTYLCLIGLRLVVKKLKSEGDDPKKIRSYGVVALLSAFILLFLFGNHFIMWLLK